MEASSKPSLAEISSKEAEDDLSRSIAAVEDILEAGLLCDEDAYLEGWFDLGSESDIREETVSNDQEKFCQPLQYANSLFKAAENVADTVTVIATSLGESMRSYNEKLADLISKVYFSLRLTGLLNYSAPYALVPLYSVSNEAVLELVKEKLGEQEYTRFLGLVATMDSSNIQS